MVHQRKYRRSKASTKRRAYLGRYILFQNERDGLFEGNASRVFLDSVGLKSREEGDLGPVYGFQWRHFGARYTNMHADYTGSEKPRKTSFYRNLGQGVDQLAEVIRKLRQNPTDRRIIMSAWNPADLKQMALPPCHMFCQARVLRHAFTFLSVLCRRWGAVLSNVSTIV